MPPAPQPVSGTPMPQNNDDLLKAISGLKEDLVREMDTRFSTYDEKLGKVDEVSNILTEAQKAQKEEMERRQAAAAAQQGYQPKTYQEIRDDAVKIALDQMKAEQKQEQERQERERQALSQEERELDAQLDRDMDTLERSGYLPKRSNPNDYNDPGVVARRELLSRAAYLETPALDKIADELTMAHRANQLWNPEKKIWESAENTLHPLPGKFAPVGNSSTAASSNSFTGPTATELRDMSMAQLAELAPQRGFGPVPVRAPGPSGF